MKTSNRDDLIAAQFMLGPMYCDFIWQERVKAMPPVPSKMRVPFKWRRDNVVPMRKRGA